MAPADLDTLSREELVTKVLKLDHELSWLKRQMFGQKTERYIPRDNGQLGLPLGGMPDSTVPPTVTGTPVSYVRKPATVPAGHGRGQMPTHLPIVDVVIEPEDKPANTKSIGEDISWQYEYKPGSLSIRRIIRPRYPRESGDGIAIAPLPPLPVEKGNMGASLIAHLMAQKFVYHVPLDRQRKMLFEESGIEFAESTLCDAIRQGAEWFVPVAQLLRKTILNTDYLQGDETTIQVLVKDKRGKTHRGYYWVYYDPVRRLVLYDYQPGRGRDMPMKTLGQFAGTLQVDGYEGYCDVFARPGVKHAACMAHVRRYFDKAVESDEARASFALTCIGEWFAVEKTAVETKLSSENRLEFRKNKTISGMDKFHGWLKAEVGHTLPQSPIGKAIAYALNQWEWFKPFREDGRIELSNNLVENSIRPIAIGRKNYMFMGSHEAAQRGAVIYSLAATAKLHGKHIPDYFTNMLTEIPSLTNKQLAPFLPHLWMPKVEK
jgi:transposase